MSLKHNKPFIFANKEKAIGKKALKHSNQEPTVKLNKNDSDEGNILKGKIQKDHVELLNRIVERGQHLDKDSIHELYRIGERNDEDWGD